MATTKKKRNPQDTTLRNLRAARKRIDDLSANIDALYETMKDLAARVRSLERVVGRR